MASYNIVGRVDLKPLQKATKAFDKFDKQTQAWAKASKRAYLTVSAAASYYAQRLARESVQAALADEKSQRQLAFTLQEVAGANNAASVAAEANIKAMSQMYGIADDELRPALARLIRVAGNTTDAFSGLDLALSLSVATNTDLESAVGALGKAYVGNFRSLKSLGLQLDEQKVKNKDLDGIIADLRRTYGQFAKNELNTTTNQFNRLKVASDEAKESIGVALIEAFMQIIDSLGGIDKVVKRIEGIGVAIADTVRGVGALIKIFKDFFAGLNAQAKALGTLGTVFLLAYKFGKLLTKLTPWRLFGAALAYTVKLSKDLGKQQRINATIAANASRQVISARNAEAVALKKLKEEEKGKADLSGKTLEQLMAEEAARKAGFKITEDIDSIQTVAAAKRLAEAREYKMSIIDAAQAQYDSLKSNYENLNKLWETQKTNWRTFQELVEKGLSVNVALKIAGIIPQGGNPPVGQAVTNQGSYLGFEDPLSLSMGANQGSVAGGNTTVNVTVNAGAIGSEEFLVGEIGNAVTKYIRLGNTTAPAGFF